MTKSNNWLRLLDGSLAACRVLRDSVLPGWVLVLCLGGEWIVSRGRLYNEETTV